MQSLPWMGNTSGTRTTDGEVGSASRERYPQGRG